VEESSSTLSYVEKAKGITNKPVATSFLKVTVTPSNHYINFIIAAAGGGGTTLLCVEKRRESKGHHQQARRNLIPEGD